MKRARELSVVYSRDAISEPRINEFYAASYCSRQYPHPTIDSLMNTGFGEEMVLGLRSRIDYNLTYAPPEIDMIRSM